MLNKSDARAKAFITETLKEREVKAAVRNGLKLGRDTIGAAIIRRVRRSLRIDRPRALTYARNLLKKYPTLEAKRVIGDVGERFGISLAASDVSHLRPGARRKRTAVTKVQSPRAKKPQRSFGAVSITHEATGTPEEVARFFRSLAGL